MSTTVARRVRTAAALALCATALAVVPAQAAAHHPRHDRRLQQELEQFLDAAGAPPGAIVLLRTPGHTEEYRAGFGDVRTGRPPMAGDFMRIASVAKAYSGAVALALVDQGTLHLDDTIARWLPILPADWGAVTLRQLLNHTSGLPDYSESDAFRAVVGADPRHHFDSRRLLDFVADKPLGFTPGTAYKYSNSDNIAVALMAEAATQCPYESLLRDLVYRPLGLRDTSLPQGYRLPHPYLHGYQVTGDPAEPYVDVSTAIGASGAWASGGIVATPDDLNRFIAGYLGPRLFSEQTQQGQLTFRDGASEPAGPGINSVGLGVFRYLTRCGTVYGHTGNTAGYTQLAVATDGGRRSLTFSINAQVNKTLAPELLTKLQKVEEDFVCRLMQS